MSIRHPTHNGAEKRDRSLQIIGSLVLLVLVGILIAIVVRGEDEKDATAARNLTFAEQVDEACRGGGEAAEELRARGACKKAKEIQATPIVGETGEAGPPGPPPSDEQVQAAVTAYCAAHTCRGETGARGPAPSPGDVAQAVALYCDARGQCQGEQGTKGDRGEKGDPPTAEQLAQAVAAYCAARDECRGPAGPRGEKGEPGRGEDGQDGAKGEPGRGITDVECRDDGTWRFTYTDGTTETVQGPCRARPLLPSP